MLYTFLQETYGNADVPLADRSLFEAAYRILKPRNMVKVVAVYDGDKPLAVDVMLIFKKQVFMWYGGSIRMPGLSPVAQLQWRRSSGVVRTVSNYMTLEERGGRKFPTVCATLKQNSGAIS